MKKTRLAATLAACSLAGALLIGGTMAYLTDTETTTNTFTVGSVTIDIQEPNYPGNGSDKVTDVFPNEEIPKDPQVKNTGHNGAVVFTRFEIPMASVRIAADDGTAGELKNQEIFGYKAANGAYNSIGSGWIQLEKTFVDGDGNVVPEASAKYARYLCGYENVLMEGQTSTPVFDVVKLANLVVDRNLDATNYNAIANSVQNINITSYAIQADNITGLTTADFNDKMEAGKLNDIYAVYVKQSGDVVSPDADTNPDQTLLESTLNITMTVDNTHLKLNTGKAADATAQATPKIAYTGNGTAPTTATFTSSKPAVATVDASGKISAVAAGETVITASVTNPDTGKTATATVTVTVIDNNAVQP